jgi:Fe-S cluster assembly protein SufB
MRKAEVEVVNKRYKEKYGFAKPEKHIFKTKKGLGEGVVREISFQKSEPAWMRDFRLRAYKIFKSKAQPTWGADISGINYDDIYYYLKPTQKKSQSWEELPREIRETYEKIGIPEAERKYLGGVGAQYDSEIIYHSIKKQWEEKGVIFLDTDEALKKYPQLFKEYFSKAVPPADNKLAALNSAVWSGGSFIYVPKGVKVDIPLQAYFRINAAQMGQFERTLIVVDEGAQVHYVEGCTAPIYSTNSLHAAVVEIFVKPGARCRYTTIQNWSKNVYNLVTKRAFVEKEAAMEWVDGNLGSKATMKYPSCFLKGQGAKGELLSLTFAGRGQEQDAGGKMVHLAPNTSSRVVAKGVSKDGGKTNFRGLVKMVKGVKGAKTHVQCSSLILDAASKADTHPAMQIEENEVEAAHEATVGKIGEDQLFYLMSRGITQDEAESLIVNGFIEPIVKELPLEYALELNRLIQLEMTGSVG